MNQQTADKIMKILDDEGMRTIQEQYDEILSLVSEDECECQTYIPWPEKGWVCPECGRTSANSAPGETDNEIALRLWLKYLTEWGNFDKFDEYLTQQKEE